MEDDEDMDEEVEAIVPQSHPPQVPEEEHYIDQMNEAGVDPSRVEQYQQGKYENCF